MSTALLWGTDELIASAGEARPAVLIEAMQRVREEARPRGNKGRGACSTDRGNEGATSAETQLGLQTISSVNSLHSVKVCMTCSSKACSSSNARDGGVEHATRTNFVNPPHMRSKMRAI